MAKLRKDTSSIEKEKSKVVTGKITKLKNGTEVPSMRNLQTKLPSTVQSQPRHFNLATPFPTNSKLKYTSTPLNNGSLRASDNLSLKKLSPRLVLSPIPNNTCNTRKEHAVAVKENLPKSDLRGSKTNNENADPKISIGTRRKSVGVRRIAPASAATENTESRLSRSRVRLRNQHSPIEVLSSDSDSGRCSPSTHHKQQKGKEIRKYPRSYVFSDSSLSPQKDRKVAEKDTSNAVNKPSIIKRLQADWSHTTLGEENPSPAAIQESRVTSEKPEEQTAKQQYRENICSKLRVRLRSSTLESNATLTTANAQHRKSCNDNSMIKRLRSDWTSSTIAETPAHDHDRTSKNIQTQRKRPNKRLLTPLVELSAEDMTIRTDNLESTPKGDTRTNNNDEEAYSSSAEFQSDDETSLLSSRSKRAPTWKELLNKTNESRVVQQKLSPPEKPRMSRRLSYKSRSPEKQEKNSQPKQKSTTTVKSCQVLESITNSKEVSRVNKEKEPTAKKSNHDDQVLDEVPSRESQEFEKANEKMLNAQDVSASEEITGSSPQLNISTKSRDENDKNKVIDLTCPVKFFHSRLENTASAVKPTESTKRRRSSRRKKQESIYEFLSQSSSESNNPADDVIQKMIKTGKVVVAKHKKGTGRNTVPRKRPKRTVKKTTTKIPEIIPVKPKQQPLSVKAATVQDKIQADVDDGFNFDDGLHFDDGEIEIPEDDHVRDQRGFSNLARSAMIKQAGRIQKPLRRKPITDKKKLLEMAMKYVNQSTPIRMTAQPISAPEFSPMPGNKSPWRVDDDKLPNLFYLGRNSDNLPSFSSDYIPMTPTKNKSKSMSSFSSNDSNGENKAPPGGKTVTNEANLQALTNTRKALSYRSPLKAINILEVINLPPLALHSYRKNPDAENASKNNSREIVRGSPLNTDKSGFKNVSKSNSNHSKSDVSNENVDNHLDKTEHQNTRKSGSDISNDNATNLFGFEEFIDDENSSTNITIDKTILPNKNSLKERLHRLKQLRPNKPVITSNQTKRIQPVFDNVRPKQKTLKQMLCSTMIDNQQHRDGGNKSFNETEDLSNLFKDPDPETTFDDSHPRRTYNRPYKRKRKILSDYATFMESDASEDEDDERPVKSYKPKPKKRQKNNPELNKFVNEFNEMCKEVSQYQLVVE